VLEIIFLVKFLACVTNEKTLDCDD